MAKLFFKHVEIIYTSSRNVWKCLSFLNLASIDYCLLKNEWKRVMLFYDQFLYLD